MADEGREEDFHAAWALSLVATNDTSFQRMIIRAIQVQRKPSLAQDELSLVRDDTFLNHQFVPLLADLLANTGVDDDERKCAARCLGERGLDALPALPLMRKAAAQTDSLGLRDEINDAIREILDLTEAEPAGANVLPASTLTTCRDWQNSTQTPVVTNGQNVTTINPTSPGAYFRLRQP